MTDVSRIRYFLRVFCAVLSSSCLVLVAVKHLEIHRQVSKFSRSTVDIVKFKYETGKPCEYEDEVDLRLIVIAYDRAKSLSKLLLTINELETDGDKAALEIWLDVNKQGQVHNETLQVARAFKWKRGTARVNVQHSNVGIYGQWIDTWRPKSPETKEVGLILEDDLLISKYSYRWIKAVHKFYRSRADYAGVTLQSDEQRAHDGSSRLMSAPKSETVYMYKCIGTWGFAPNPSQWMLFQNWYHTNHKNAEFHPYVPGTITTEWYRSFERTGREDTMWEQWYIYYAYKEKLFTVYSNLKTFNGDGSSCFCINRREVGLHYASKGPEDLCTLLNRWDNKFVSFSHNVTKLNWNGLPTKEY